MKIAVRAPTHRHRSNRSETAARSDARKLLAQAASAHPISLPHRATLEARFGQRLDQIAVYASPDAQAALALLDAEAVTYQGAIFLPDPHPALDLITHEVAHALQMQAGDHGNAEIVTDADPAEREAAALAAQASQLAAPAPALAVHETLPPTALALRRAGASGAPPNAAAEAVFERTVEREPTPIRSAAPNPPTPAAPSLTTPFSPPAMAPEQAAFALPPAPAPGISATAVAERQAVQAATEAALATAASPEALMVTFANAPPTVKAQRAAALGGEMDRLAKANQAGFADTVPDLRAELHCQVEPAPSLEVATPAARALDLAVDEPLPQPELPPTPDPGRYTANDAITASVSRLMSGEADERAANLTTQLRDVRTSDDIATSPGAPPPIPLSGGADPAQIDEQIGEGITQTRQMRAEAAQAVINGPGPEQAQPATLDEAYPVGELAQPEIAAPAMPAEPQAYLEMGLPPEVQTAFDQQQQATMESSLAEARAQVDEASAERDRQRAEAVAEAQAQAQEQSAQADEQQRAGVSEARQRIQTARQETLDAQQAAVTDIEQQASDERATRRRDIDERARADEAQIEQRYANAEREAQAEVAQGEREAAAERERAAREAREQSWWDRAVNFVRDAFAALTRAIGAIFDAVRRAVNAVLDAAKAFAMRLIDAAVAFVNGVIAAFGALLKGLIDTLIGSIFPELAARLNAAIDEAVAFAQRVVTAAAEGLKAGIAALVEGLRAGLNAIINAYQAAVQIALAAVQAALTGDWAALARMALEAVLRVAGIDPATFYQFIGRAQETFQLILDDPGGFVGHLIDAFLGGVRRFADNFLTHLQAGIIGWLTGAIGGAGIRLPERFDLMGVLSLIQQILGLTWERLRERAVRLIGERAVAVIEFVADYLRTLIEGGWDALWQRIQDDLASLRDMVLQGIKDFLFERIVMAAITRLATMFNPVGAIVNLILTAYNLFTFLRDQLTRIIAVVQTVINAIGDIARGIIQPAAQRVEEVLAGLLPLAIDLLARLLGLGNVGNRVREIIERVRGVVDRAIDRLIERVRGMFRGGDAERRTEAESAPMHAAGQPADKSFQLARQNHTLRGRLTGRRLTILMASNSWSELDGLITNIRRLYITGTGDRPGLMHATPRLAHQLDQRLKEVENVTFQVIRDAEASPDEAQRVVVTNAGLDRIKTLLAPLREPPFFVDIIDNTQSPTHRYSPVSTDGHGRAVSAVGDPISSASRGEGSAASVDPPGLRILDGMTGAPKYERGHLLANALGGPGNDIRNLTPISPATNIAMRDGPEEQARNAIYDATAYPPNILRYVVRCRYRDISGLESWLTRSLGAASGSAMRLYTLARTNTSLNATNVHNALGGTTQLPLNTVTSNLDSIRKQLAYYFMTHQINITIQSLQGPTAITPNHSVSNHQGFTLP